MGGAHAKTPRQVLDRIQQFQDQLEGDLQNKPEQHFSLDLSRQVDFEAYMKHKTYSRDMNSKDVPPDIIFGIPKETIEFADQIRYLKVNFHGLAEVPSSIQRFSRLKILQLRCNRIAKIHGDICKIQSLTFLDLHDNYLETIPKSLMQLKHLQKLDLSSNEISELPEVGDMDFLSLCKLNLNSNRIAKLPDGFSGLKNLKIVMMSLNKCTDPPQEVCNRGSKELLTYFRNKGTDNAVIEDEKEVHKLDLDQGEPLSPFSASDVPDSDVKLDVPGDATTLSSETLCDKIGGVLFGNAVGDAIGLLTEFMNRDQAHFHCFLPLNYDSMVRDRHRCKWTPGDWTDDTDQMLVILNSILKNKGRVDILDIAASLREWSEHGFPEFGDQCGFGIGNTVGAVLNHSKFLEDPHGAALSVFNARGKRAHSNGAVMRTSILGVHQFHDHDAVIKNTINVSKITHASPRCTASCIAVTTFISEVLRGTDHQSVELLERCYAEGCKFLTEEEQKEFRNYIFVEDLSFLNLEESQAIGYTFKTAGCGFWAVQSGLNFESAITMLVLEGGDADTNCAVAGAMLGVVHNYSGLPRRWVASLLFRDSLTKKVQQLCTVINLEY